MKLAGTGVAPAACQSSKVSAENRVHVFVFARVPVCPRVRTYMGTVCGMCTQTRRPWKLFSGTPPPNVAQ